MLDGGDGSAVLAREQGAELRGHDRVPARRNQRAAEVVEDLTRSLPSGSDIVDVEALREDGKVVIEYGQSLLDADPQVLEDTMREAAERARNAIPDLKDVEFRVGDRTFTY